MSLKPSYTESEVSPAGNTDGADSWINTVWELLFAPVADEIAKLPGMAYLGYLAPTVIKRYESIRDHCKDWYTNDGRDHLLDRHKLSASMIVAVIKTRPIQQVLYDDRFDAGSHFVANESLALRGGLLFMRRIIIENLMNNNKWHFGIYSDSQIAKLKHYFIDKDGLLLYPKAYHGDYESSFALQLAHDYIDGCLSVLSIANLLFLIEKYTFQEIFYSDAI